MIDYTANHKLDKWFRFIEILKVLLKDISKNCFEAERRGIFQEQGKGSKAQQKSYVEKL